MNNVSTTPLEAGIYTVILDIPQGDNYYAATLTLDYYYMIMQREPDKSDLDITIPSGNVYDGTQQPVTIDVLSSVTGMGTIIIRYNGSDIPPTDAGKYEITVDIEQGQNYSARVGLYIDDYYIYKRQLTEPDLDYILPITHYYNGNPQGIDTVKPKSSIPNFDGYIIVKYDNVATNPTDAGVYDVSVEIVAGKNYAAVSNIVLIGNYTISKGGLTDLDLEYNIPTDHIYNGVQQGIGLVEVKAGIGFDGDVIVKYDGIAVEPVNAGTYQVTVDLVNAAFYDDVFDILLGDYIISKKMLTVTADDTTIKQGDILPNPMTLTITYTGFVGTDDELEIFDVLPQLQLNVPNSAVACKSVIDFSSKGTLNILGSTNYDFAYVNGALIIESTVGITYIPQQTTIKAYVNDGILHVSGLTQGDVWSVYNVSGALIYQSTANSDVEETLLVVSGVYFVKSGKVVVKVVYAK